ncbi:hypothetical protein BBG47_26980 [Paenibacillus sp. KS1]|uniref:Imm64 family immunity protein n=1 Tax=Paenibacillus sp. KS1 TaxID=1849249 RepID=UPI0008065C81|nr:Imm64 family immunity protein [Paenibacillus sp. KS1]OBY76464.1 hypothetical protein BBG47_26980 [Paenibacillus sp. KS1]
MGASINVGLIYCNELDVFSKRLYSIMDFLVSSQGEILSMKYALDEDALNWVETGTCRSVDSNLINELLQNYFAEISINTGSLFVNSKNICISVEKNEGHHSGVIISFQESEIIVDYSIEELDSATDFMVDFIKQVYQIAPFDFAFCDHEAEIIYPLNGVEYSIMIYPTSVASDILVEKSNWHLNGLTKRY